MPAVRQKRSKLAPTSCQASSTIATGTTAAGVVVSLMALLSFVESAPRAYRLKVGNACPPISTSTGTSPRWSAPSPLVDVSVEAEENFRLGPKARRLVSSVPRPEGWRWQLRTHPFRKTFARFIASRDRSRLLGIAEHFKHASAAILASSPLLNRTGRPCSERRTFTDMRSSAQPPRGPAARAHPNLPPLCHQLA